MADKLSSYAEGVFDPEVMGAAQLPSETGVGAPEVTLAEAVIRQIRLQPTRDPNEIRDTYGLPKLSPDELDTWLAIYDPPGGPGEA